MSRVDLDTPLFNESQIFCALRTDGWTGNTQQLRQLAHKGEELRRRWEAACNYAWAADENGSYAKQTATLELAAVGFVHNAGLYCFLQGDPRGAPIYVALHPLDDTSYTRGYALYWEN